MKRARLARLSLSFCMKRKRGPLVGTESFVPSIDHTMPPDRTFRRNFFVIAALHVVALAIIYFISGWPRKAPTDGVMWLENGSVGGGDAGGGRTPRPSRRPA